MTDYIRPELFRVIKLLESWAEGQLNPPEPFYGICTNLAYSCKLLAAGDAGLVAAAAKSWPEFSGDAEYPVPHEHVSPESAYTETFDVPKWDNDAYGQARRRLCQHIADWIRANPEAAAEFLRGD